MISDRKNKIIADTPPHFFITCISEAMYGTEPWTRKVIVYSFLELYTSPFLKSHRPSDISPVYGVEERPDHFSSLSAHNC